MEARTRERKQVAMQVLIVEDDVRLAQALAHILAENGYQTDVVHDGASGLAYAECGDYDVIILDVMLPKMDGFAVVAQLRRKSISVPVLLLTARDAVQDRVEGLDTGADDYLTKPYDFSELMARVRALLRRSGPAKTNQLTIADLVMDLSSRRVTRAGQEIALSSREFALLEYLLRNKGAILSRGQLENHVWDYGLEGGSNIVDVYIRFLRKKIDEPFGSRLIQTVRGLGYTIREEA